LDKLGKLGRKICCNFNKEVKCILLVDGNKLCIFDESTEDQNEKGDAQIGICPLLPESEREELLAAMKEEGYSNFRTFKN
jgi:hypothetical protein